MEPLITLNINKIIDQIAAANTKAGELTAEVEYLNGKNDELRKEVLALRDELTAIKEELNSEKDSKDFWYGQYNKYHTLYEGLTKEAE